MAWEDFPKIRATYNPLNFGGINCWFYEGSSDLYKTISPFDEADPPKIIVHKGKLCVTVDLFEFDYDNEEWDSFSLAIPFLDMVKNELKVTKDFYKEEKDLDGDTEWLLKEYYKITKDLLKALSLVFEEIERLEKLIKR